MYFILQTITTILGLILDIIGAWYIARGLVLKTTKEFISESAFFFGNNDNLVVSGFKQRIECRIGFTMMFIGFGLQLVSQINQDNIYMLKVDTVSSTVLILVLIVFCLLITRLLNFIINRKYLADVESYINNKIMHTNQINVLDAIRYIRYIVPDYSAVNMENEDVEKELCKVFSIRNDKKIEVVGKLT